MLVRPLDIGGIATRNNLVLSPMSGVTDSAFRRMVQHCSGDAVGLLVSEFIAAEGLTRENAKTFGMLRFVPSERPISIQIFGADLDRMVLAARMVEETGADIVDINCGCPAPKVVRRGGGAQLLREPDHLASVVAAVVKAVRIPVTVKIRSGWDDSSINAVDVARRVENAGAAMIAVHGRTRVQLYSGSADWDVVRSVREALTIPVVGSGDVTRAEQALERIASGASDGVMIGRAALSNPWIFAEAAAFDAGRVLPERSAAELVAALGVFRDGMRETKPDSSFIGRYRGLACHFIKGMRDSAATRAEIGRAVTVTDVDAVFTDFVGTRGETPYGARELPGLRQQGLLQVQRGPLHGLSRVS
jgi:nifR3 family TIM-barrel protein